MVRTQLCGADAGPDPRLGQHRERTPHVDARAHRQRQDARGILVVSRSAGSRSGRRRDARRLRVADQGARVRHRAQPARAARRAPGDGRRRPDRGRRPHRRYANEGTRAPAQTSRPDPDHDAGIAVPVARRALARAAAQRRHDHRRRDPRARADQARHPSRAHARAARASRDQLWQSRAAADRPVGDATSTYRGS